MLCTESNDKLSKATTSSFGGSYHLKTNLIERPFNYQVILIYI